ncbi:DUF4253 domain-containing protein [Paractinoplanes ferrugineus]|uniref:DUF4253 domain-containing protein n=1 Tax=Paractinoplanes ferrugineus TaxID=113564 RepID=A0A919JAR7_9ACTN|nr:hypothetical protein Afe05nite_76590 [Actinoplanes ferrugineus]
MQPPDLPAALSRRTVPLPPGRLVHGEDDDTPILWLSDAPATVGLWQSLYAAHPAGGLYPILLDHLPGDPRRPWDDGELWPGLMSSPDDHDAAEVLAGRWTANADPSRAAVPVTTPFGAEWPGLADPIRPGTDPDEQAVEGVRALLARDPSLRLGLVAAARGSDAVAVCGWTGPVNHDNDTAKYAAVLRSWERRFGVRLIALGFADLRLSVAAPPTDDDECLRVAAEHFAFAPDNIVQGTSPLSRYATNLLYEPIWSFWWD